MAKTDLDRTSIKIRTDIYRKLSEYVEEEKRKGNPTSMQSYMDTVLEEFILGREQDKLIQSSNFEMLLMEQFKKMDKHLASMIARNQMDISITVVSLMDMIYHVYGKETDKSELYAEYRVEAAKYFTGQSQVYPRSRDKVE